MANAARLTLGLGTGSTADKRMRLGYIPKPLVFASRITLGLGDGSTANLRMRFGFSTLAGFPITIPAGKQAVVVAGLPWVPPARSVLEGAVPDVREGDVILCDKVSTPNGYKINMNADGTFNIETGTDPSRQSFVCDVYSLSLSGFYGEFTTTVNNQVPTQTAGIVLSALTVGSAMTPLDLSAFVIDAEGDALTYSVAPGSDPLPAGLTLVGSVISGTPTATTLRNVVIRVTDSVGDYLDLPSIAMGPAEAVESATSGRWYGVDLETGQWSVMELGSIPSTALAVVIDYNAIGSKPGDRNRAINALKALQYYLLRSPWPPV